MCLATPAKILSIDDSIATVTIEGIHQKVNVSLIEDAHIGDYVIIHAGFAIQKWTDEDVQEFYAIKKEIENAEKHLEN